MGVIETRAKPHLTKLMLGQAMHLNAEVVQAVRNWVALKVIVGEYDDPNAVTIPPSELKAFWGSRYLTGTWQIYIAKYCGNQWIKRRQHRVFYVTEKTPTIDWGAVRKNAQVTIMVGGMLAIIAFHTSSDKTQGLDFVSAMGDYLLPISENADLTEQWASKKMLGDYELNSLSHTLDLLTGG